jgi:glc operon protein GlcG
MNFLGAPLSGRVAGANPERQSMSAALERKPALNLVAARIAMAACEAEAIKGNWKVTIAIVDDGGHAILVQRLDGAQWSSVATALGKAKTSVAFKRPTGVLEEMINNGRTAFLSIPGDMTFLQGGVPIERDGAIVGAIGVSGVKASDDETIALAGARALAG